MNTLLEILKYTLPTLISLGVVYLIISKFLKNDEIRRNYEVRKSVANTITPMKLGAYERLVLFLERITPESLILRTHRSNMSNVELQTALLQAIRMEYEHNFSQQLYVSNKASEVVKNAKESIIQLINMSATQVKPEDSSTQLSMLIIETYASVDEPPAKVAVDFLRNEVRSYFG